MIMRRFHAVSLLSAGLLACPALAALPSPIDPARVAFPGGVVAPGSAASASLALADRWLGEEPFDNPAVPRRFALSATPVLLHVSRQDLRSDNRNFEEQFAFPEIGGAWAGVPLGAVQLSAYFHQALLRRESNTYLLGRGLGGGPSAALASETGTREMHEGLAASIAVGPARLGVAAEWTHRADFYDLTEVSGSPDEGHRRASFSGGGLGAQAGGRLDLGPASHRVELGGAVRWVPSLDLEGVELRELLSDTSSTPVAVSRTSGWEGGVSARVAVSETFRATAGLGGSGRQEWKEFGVTSGPGFEWKVGGEFHDPAAPWTFRFGFGSEQRRGGPEPRAGVVALGLGWTLTSAQLDFALIHYAIGRADQPTSFDDRLVATVSLR
jgi:hypothetical protein